MWVRVPKKWAEVWQVASQSPGLSLARESQWHQGGHDALTVGCDRHSGALWSPSRIPGPGSGWDRVEDPEPVLFSARETFWVLGHAPPVPCKTG